MSSNQPGVADPPIPLNVTQKHQAGLSIYQDSDGKRTSLDVSQRLERKIAQYNTSQNMLKRWFFELVSLVMAAIRMITIIGVSWYSQNRPLSSWPLALTIINVSSKVASAALILPISESIGQLKWVWFNGQSKDIINFEIFDKASRGAWSSFLLLCRTKGRSLAALGAVLTILLLATDAFFQQLIDLPERWTLHGTGVLPRTIRYEGDNGILYKDGAEATMEDINLRQVTYKYFYYNGDQPFPFDNSARQDLPLSCPSSRCEWDEYESLGFCSACEDVSNLLTYACLTTKLDWISSVYFREETYPTGTACGYWLNATSSKPVLMSGYRLNDTLDLPSTKTPGEALLLRTLPLNTPYISVHTFSGTPHYGGSINFKDVYFPLVDALILSASDGTTDSVYAGKPPAAQECIITWCVKTIESSYIAGSYHEKIKNTIINTTARAQPYPWETWPAPPEEGDYIYTQFNGNISIVPPASNSKSIEFGVSNETFRRTASLFDDMFPSSITAESLTAPSWWRVKIYAWGLNQLRSVTPGNPWLAPNNVTEYLEKFTTSMTNVIRSHSSHEFIEGRAYSQVTFIVVHWEWLTFPLVIFCFCLIFLVATMTKTAKHHEAGLGMWKTSTMPTLIYGLPPSVQKEIANPSNWGDVSQAKTKKVRIRLLPNHGWRVSGQYSTSPKARSDSQSRVPPGWI